MRFISSVAGKKFYILILILTQILLGASGVLYALLMRGTIDAAVAGKPGEFVKNIIEFALLVIGQIALRAVLRFMNEYAKSAYENSFKKRLFETLMYRDYGSVVETHSGEWMNRLTSDTQVVADGLVSIVPGALGMLAKIVSAVVMIVIFEPRFGLILFPGCALLVVITLIFRRHLKNLHKNVQESDGKVRMYLQDHLGSLAVVKTFAREEAALDGVSELMKDHRKARIIRNRFSNFCNIGFGAVMHGAYCIGVIYGGYGILTGTLTYGTMTALLQLIGQIQTPLANITGYVPAYYSMIASAERLMEAEFFSPDYDPEEKVHSSEEVLSLYRSDFAGFGFKDVDFAYADKIPVLTDFSMMINRGEFVALTGPSGCGKSTILRLLMNLYKPVSGERFLLVCPHGETEAIGTRANSRSSMYSVMELNSSWRRLFAYVPQGNQLMAGSIREILTFSDPEKMRNDELINRSLAISCAGFVTELENGVDTILGERGQGLSEGQIQRIAIARAVCSERPILLLDEATSSLDEQTERQVLDNIRAMTDKTVIIVTHRPAALAVCDREVNLQPRS